MKPRSWFKILPVFLLTAHLFAYAPSAEAFVFQDRVATSKSLAHYAMGQIYDLLGLTNRAVLEYEKAAQFDDGSYLIHLRLGTDYARLNMLQESIEQLKLVAKLNEDELQSHYLLALIYSNQKEYDLAAAEYEYILKKFSSEEPQNIEIYGYLGQLYYSQRKYDEAIKQFEKILEFDNENPDIMYLLGSLYLEVDRVKESMNILKKSIEIDPVHEGSLNTLGYLYAENDMNLDEAEKLVERALQVNPNNGAYLDSLGWVYFKKGEYQKALNILKRADSQLQDPVIYDHLGDVYHKLNDFDEALKHWELSLELLPDQQEVIDKINKIKSKKASTQEGVSL